MSSNTIPQPSIIEEKQVDYSKLIPFATAGLIFLGVTHLMLYYGLFGIKILSFLEFGEIITSFLDIVIAFTIGITTTVILLYLSDSNNQKKRKYKISTSIERDKASLTKEETLELLGEELKSLKRRRNKAIIVLSIAVLLLISMLYRHWELLLIYFIGLTILVFVCDILFKIYHRHNSKLIKDLCLIALVLTASELLTIIITINEYNSVKNSELFFDTKIVFNNNTYLKDSSHVFKSDSSNFYIGQTNKYIFIHHLQEGITSIYPISSVVQMDLKKSKPQTWIGNLFPK